MLLNIPGNPRLWPTFGNLAISLLFGDLKYLSEKIKITTLINKKKFKLFIIVLSLIHTYLSMKLVFTPYASNLSVVIIF